MICWATPPAAEAADETGERVGRIVVGVDGSEASRRALAWALEEAALRGASVEAVHAWRVPSLAALSLVPVVDFSHRGREVLDRAVRDVIDAAADRLRAVPLSAVLRDGPVQQALCQVAEGADLLVVGTRGRGAFEGLVLGSVSQYVAGRAPCPVVVTR